MTSKSHSKDGLKNNFTRYSYGVTGWEIWDSNSGRDKRFFFLFRTLKLVHGPTHRVQGFPRGVKRWEREVYLSPPSNAEAQNESSCTSALSVHLHGLKSYKSFLQFKSQYKHLIAIPSTNFGNETCEKKNGINLVSMPSFSEFYAWKTQLPLCSLPDFNAKDNFEA